MALLCWAAFMEGVSAQPAPDRVFRVGFISVSQGSLESFRQYAMPELARRGFVEGETCSSKHALASRTRSQRSRKTLIAPIPT